MLLMNSLLFIYVVAAFFRNVVANFLSMGLMNLISVDVLC